MMEITKKLISMIVLCTAIDAGAISRVGNMRIQSLSAGFELTLPNSHPRTQQVSKESILIQAFVPVARAQRNNTIEISTFLARYEELQNMNISQLEGFFEKRGWTKKVERNGMQYSFRKRNGNNINEIIVWGKGKGVTFLGKNNSVSKKAVELMKKSLEVKYDKSSKND